MARATARLHLCRYAMTFLVLILLPALNAVAQDCGDPVAKQTDNLKFIADIEPSTTWQPPLGEVKFTIAGNGFKPDNIVACFRWARTDDAIAKNEKNVNEASSAVKEAQARVDALAQKKNAAPSEVKAVSDELDAANVQLMAATEKLNEAIKERDAADALRWVKSSSLRVVASDTNKTTFAAKVPSDIPYGEKWIQKIIHTGEVKHYGSWSTVPVANLRVISSGLPAQKTDYVLEVGITSVTSSLALAAIFLVIAWAVLQYFSTMWGLPGAGFMLKIISTQAGYASLSQFQILLWTFVVGTGAVYVMALSGNLIDISTGTLVLLGITGIATLGSKLKGGQDSPSASDSAPTPTLPGAITEIVTQASQSEVKLSWRPPSVGGPAAAYTVQYRVTANPANSWTTAVSSLTRPSFTVIGLTPGTAYDFQVSASNPGGPGPATVVSETTAAPIVIPSGAPGQVPNLGAAGSPTASTLNLIWGQPGAAPTGYLVEYRVHDSDEFWQSARCTAAGTAFTVTRLLPYTHYDFRITPINSAGSGPPSSIVSARTGPRTPLWSDLVIPNDFKREVDVTRVQMLFFTLITAIFVAVKILVSSEIPDIPQGFLLLMGISNGVYLTAKFIPD